MSTQRKTKTASTFHKKIFKLENYRPYKMEKTQFLLICALASCIIIVTLALAQIKFDTLPEWNFWCYCASILETLIIVARAKCSYNKLQNKKKIFESELRNLTEDLSSHNSKLLSFKLRPLLYDAELSTMITVWYNPQISYVPKILKDCNFMELQNKNFKEHKWYKIELTLADINSYDEIRNSYYFDGAYVL